MKYNEKLLYFSAPWEDSFYPKINRIQPLCLYFKCDTYVIYKQTKHPFFLNHYMKNVLENKTKIF